MTECAASLSHIQKHVYKLDGVPGCRAETQLDGTSECIIYAQLLLMNSFSGVYTDAFLEQRREEFLSDSGQAVTSITVRLQLQDRLSTELFGYDQKEQIATEFYDCLAQKLIGEEWSQESAYKESLSCQNDLGDAEQ